MLVSMPKKAAPTIPQSMYFGEHHGRTRLAPSKKFADFPDLLDMQTQGFNSFLEKYLEKLFDDINPVNDIAGEKL